MQSNANVRVWVSYGNYEAGIDDDVNSSENNTESTTKHSDLAKMRTIFERGYTALKQQGLKDERVSLLNSWRECELTVTDGDVALVEAKMPRKVKVRRTADDGSGVREMHDYLFPDEETAKPGLKLLENAMKWKAAAAAAATTASSEETAVSEGEAQADISSPPPPPQREEEIDIDNI